MAPPAPPARFAMRTPTLPSPVPRAALKTRIARAKTVRGRVSDENWWFAKRSWGCKGEEGDVVGRMPDGGRVERSQIRMNGIALRVHLPTPKTRKKGDEEGAVLIAGADKRRGRRRSPCEQARIGWDMAGRCTLVGMFCC